jgi:hypothetical protein
MVISVFVVFARDVRPPPTSLSLEIGNRQHQEDRDSHHQLRYVTQHTHDSVMRTAFGPFRKKMDPKCWTAS